MLINRFRDNDRFSLFTPRADQPIPGGSGTAGMIGRVVTATPNIAVGRFLLVNPVSVYGPEVEGGAGVTTVGSSTAVPVYLIGPEPAQQGEMLVCRFIEHRWVAERGGTSGGGGFFLPGCPCTSIPRALFMHVARQPPGHVEAIVYPSPLTLGPRPDDLSAYRSDSPGYYSGADFVSSDLFYRFRYWFGCSQGSYFVGGLITPDSPLGFPGFFLIASFLVGVPGNTCAPFSMAAPASGNPTFQQQGVSIDAKGPA